MRRFRSGDLESAGRRMRHGIEKSRFVKTLMKVIGVLAVSMVMSDGVLTPAQSVLGAVQGIEVVDPTISKGTIVGTTAGILILLFAAQPFGTTKIAVTFAPIIIIWRAFIAVFGGVLLAFTGVEALFADLGAFSRHAIQLSWLCYTFPCLLLAYIGQAAYISVHPTAYTNPFFNAAPPGTIYPSLIIAILAAIVASQAIITATFQVSAVPSSLRAFAN
jgi:KUP system potassium uptake protein